MADKPKLESFVSPPGIAIYPHIITPDTKFDSDGVYTTQVALTAGPATDVFINQLEAARNKFIEEFKAVDKKNATTAKKASVADVYEDETDEEGEETGRILIRAKQKAQITGKDGKVFKKSVKLFDAANNVIAPDSLWSGSKLVLAGVLVPYYMASSKEFGVSLRLAAVQVLELVQGGDGQSAEGYGFEATDGYTAETAASVAADAAGGDEDDDGDGDF